MRWLRPRAKEPPVARDASDEVRFYFYFEDEETARWAASVLEGKGYGVEVNAPREGILEWGVQATGVPEAEDLEEADEALRPWAARLGGEYDGHEIRLDLS